MILVSGVIGIVVAQQAIQNIEAAGPEFLVEGQPVMRAGERNGLQPADMGAALHLAPDEPCSLKHLYVLGGRRQRHVEGLSQLPNRALAISQLLQYAAPGLVAQGMKDGVKPRVF